MQNGDIGGRFSLVFCCLATPVKSCFQDGSFEEPVKAHEINDRIWVSTVLDRHRVGQSVPDSQGHNSHTLSQMLYSIFLWRSFKVEIRVSISTFWVSTLCFMVCLEVIQTDEGLEANRPTPQAKWKSGRLSDWQLITEFNFYFFPGLQTKEELKQREIWGAGEGKGASHPRVSLKALIAKQTF